MCAEHTALNLINHLRISTFDCVAAGEFADGLTLILISSPVCQYRVPARRMGEEGRAPLFVCLNLFSATALAL